jgi:hypothetical protein
MYEFLADLGDEATERPSPTLRGSVVAAAALLAMIGLIAIAIDSNDSDTNVLGIVLGLLAVGLGHGIIVALPVRVRPAGIVLIASGTVAALAFLFDDIDSPTLLLLLLAAAYIGQWVLGPARGATPLLTLGLLSTWALLLDVVASDDSSSSAVPLSDIAIPDSAFTSGDETVSYVSLLIGIGLLLATRVLDGRGFRGTATSAVIVGDVAFVIGVFGVVSTFEDDVAGSIFVIVAGLVLAYVGAGGTRRFTTWLGGIGVLIGLLALLTTAIDLTDAVQFGIVSISVGGAIILAAAFIYPTDEGALPLVAADGGGGPETDTSSAESNDDDAEIPLTPPVADEPKQGWHVDPSGRHQLRWHDGTAWTNHVSDEGATSTDEGL